MELLIIVTVQTAYHNRFSSICTSKKAAFWQSNGEIFLGKSATEADRGDIPRASKRSMSRQQT